MQNVTQRHVAREERYKGKEILSLCRHTILYACKIADSTVAIIGAPGLPKLLIELWCSLSSTLAHEKLKTGNESLSLKIPLLSTLVNSTLSLNNRTGNRLTLCNFDLRSCGLCCRDYWCGSAGLSCDPCFAIRMTWQIIAVVAAMVLMSRITMPAYVSIIHPADPTVLVATLGT